MQLGSLRRTALYPGLSASGLCPPHAAQCHLPRATDRESSPKQAQSRDAENLGATGQGGNHGPSDCSDACGGLQPACTESQEPGPWLGDAVWPWYDQLAPCSLNSSPAPTPVSSPDGFWLRVGWEVGKGTPICFWKVILGGFCPQFLTLPPWPDRGLWTDKVGPTSVRTELKTGGAAGRRHGTDQTNQRSTRPTDE